MSIELELRNIRKAFRKVKQDNIYLSRRVDALEKSKEELLRIVLKEKTETKIVEAKSNSKIYIGNTSSKKVHSQDCPYGRKIKNEKREIFDSIQDALKKKYKRCSCVSA